MASQVLSDSGRHLRRMDMGRWVRGWLRSVRIRSGTYSTMCTFSRPVIRACSLGASSPRPFLPVPRQADPDKARALNATGPAALAAAARRVGARTVFLSTDYVFDGEAGPYDEQAVPKPLNVYGKARPFGAWASP